MYNILIIDDEPIVKIALRSILTWENHGFKICATASNGVEALTMVTRHQPQIIITDLKMPKMDGIELIRSLKENQYEGEIIVLSNYDDFEYVRNALLLGAADYILKIKIEPKSLLDSLNKAVKNLHHRNIQHGKVTSEEAVHAILKDFFNSSQSLKDFINLYPEQDFSFFYEPCSICCLSFEHHLKEKNEYRHMSASLIRNTLLEALQGQKRAQLVFLSKHQILVVFSQAEVSQKITLQQLAGKLSNQFTLYQSLNPMIIYHWNIKDYDNARTIYSRLQDIWQLRFYGEISLLDAQSIHMVHHLTAVQYKEIAINIHSGGLKNLESNLNILDLLITRCREEHIYPEILRMLFIKILDFIGFLDKDIQIEAHDFLIEAKEAIYYCTNSQELKSYMCDSLQAIFASSSENTENNQNEYRPEISQVIDYLHNNYTHKITLNAVSTHVNLSLSYLCRIFKSETGISIMHYINRLRMENAGKLISEQRLTIKEVAVCVGIEDQLYFSRLFKKHYGVPPSEFK